MSSETRYAQSGDVHVADRVFGAGPVDLVFAMGLDYPSAELPVREDVNVFAWMATRRQRRPSPCVRRPCALRARARH